MEKKNLRLLLIGVAVLVVALLAGLFFFMQKNKEQGQQIAQTEQFMEEEKQSMVTEMETMAGDMDGYSVYIHNDSLLRDFDKQKQKIKELQEELKRTKATDAKKIAQLKDEIATLRKILAHYIQQIDSLNSLNKRLTSENIEVKQRYQSATATAEQLARDKETLTETVTRASVLELYNFAFSGLDKRSKKADRASKMETLKFNFTIGKNITAQPGPKTVYLRLTRPDGEVMTHGNASFEYENKSIAYSLSKSFDYTSDAYSDALYWKVEEILQLSSYQADFFADGNRIGSFSFRIEKK